MRSPAERTEDACRALYQFLQSRKGSKQQLHELVTSAIACAELEHAGPSCMQAGKAGFRRGVVDTRSESIRILVDRVYGAVSRADARAGYERVRAEISETFGIPMPAATSVRPAV